MASTSGTHPEKLKQKITAPIHKKGSRQDIKLDRPNSVLTNLKKSVGKVIHDRKHKFADKYENLYPLQFGVRNIHTTNQA